MERAEDERLVKLKESGETVYSFSRLGTFNTCLYAGYKGYVLKEQGRDNAWNLTGSRVHDTLELIVNGGATEADLLPAINAELADMEMLGIEFPKDSKGGDSLRENWVKDMFHFCQTYQSPKGKNLKTEEIFIYETPKHRHLVGYIDLQHIFSDGTVAIYDYKTSSMFTKENIKEHNYQLLTYLLGLRQQGITVRKAAFIMLKYVDISYMGKKTSRSKEKELIKKSIERRKIGEELEAPVSALLRENGIDEAEIEFMINDMKRTNMLNRLPEKVQKEFKIRPCILECDISEDSIKECEEYIDDTIDMWEALDKSSAKDFPPKKFTKTLKNGKEVPDLFFCTSLCSYGHTCVYLKDYLDTHDLGKKDNVEDLF